MRRDGTWNPAIPVAPLLVTLLLFWLPTANTMAGETGPTPRHRIIAGGDRNYPPYEWVDENGHAVGFNVDLIRAVSRAAGLDVAFRLGHWPEVRKELETGGIDVLAMYKSAERMPVVDFTEPFDLIYYAIFIRKNTHPITDLADLRNRTVIVQENALMHDYLKENDPGAHLILVESEPEALRRLSAGTADCAIVSHTGGLYAIQRLGLTNLAVSGPQLLPRGYALAVRKGNIALRDRLDEGLKTIKETGQYAQIYARWFGERKPERWNFQVLLWYGGIVVVLLLLLAALVFAWGWSLDRKVEEKTRELHERNLELIESRRFIESVVNLIPEILYIYDLVEKRYVYSNNGMERVLGYTTEEIQAMEEDGLLPTLMHPEDFAIYREKTCRRYREVGDHEPIAHQYRMKRKDGQWRWLDCVEQIYARGADGSPKQIVGVAVDRTDQIAAQQAQAELAARLVTILENMGDAFVSLDKNWCYTYVNRKAGELFGRDPASLIGKHIWTEFPEGIGQPFYKAYYRAVEEQREIRLEEFYPPWERWFENRIYPTPDGLSIFFTDITERKRVEQKLAQYRKDLEVRVQERTVELEESQKALLNLLEDMNEARAQLEQANARLAELDRLKSMFIASMSHELRTPLNSIIGFTGMLLQELPGTLNEEQKKQLAIVKKSSHHLLDLINDIIDISKIEAGKIRLEWSDCSLFDLVASAAESVRPTAVAKGLTLTVEPVADAQIRTDARRLSQVILNLLSNAIKFTESGKVRVAIETDESGVRISISDTGKGMDAEDLTRLFQPFSRLHKPGEPFVPGTGLGLYLSRKLVDLMGGDITVDSEPGKGSRFTVFLPFDGQKNA